MQLGRLAAMGLLACWPSQEAGSDDGSGREHSIPLFMAHGNAEGRQGFIRIINHSDEPGVVEIVAIDDRGERYGPVELEMDERQTVHLNSEDLENSNADKGLNEGLGSGEGNWRLLLYGGALDIEPLAYIRTPVDGFLTSNDVVPDASMATDDIRWRIIRDDAKENRSNNRLLAGSRTKACAPTWRSSRISRYLGAVGPKSPRPHSRIYIRPEKSWIRLLNLTAEYRSGDWVRGRYNVGETVRSFHGWAGSMSPNTEPRFSDARHASHHVAAGTGGIRYGHCQGLSRARRRFDATVARSCGLPFRGTHAKGTVYGANGGRFRYPK